MTDDDGTIDFAEARDDDAGDPTISTLRGASDGESEHEDIPAAVFGVWCVLARPAAPSSSGACDLVILRRGDEVVGIASRDRRWVRELEPGEVLITAGHENGPTIRITPDGDVTIEVPSGKKIRATAGGTTDEVAMAGKVEAELGKIRDALAAAQAPAGTAQAPLVFTPPSAAYVTVGDTASTSLEADT